MEHLDRDERERERQAEKVLQPVSQESPILTKQRSARTPLEHCEYSCTRSKILPRFIRLRDAPDYLGIDKNRFNDEVRPYLTQIPIGSKSVAFDRLDLDAWADDYKARNGQRPGKVLKGGTLWDRKSHQDWSKGGTSGTSKKRLQDTEFAKALERAASRKQRDT